MGRPYNKKTVEEAALLCETIASNPHLGDMTWVALFLGIRESSTAFTLAGEAVNAVCQSIPAATGEVFEELWAEAAALIADGWQIGDEVVLLNHVDVIADENVPQDRVYLLNKNADGSLTPAGAVVFHIDDRKMQDGVLPIAEAPMTDEMKSKASTALEAMTTAPVETETKLIGGANVMDENGLEPPEPSYNPGDNFYAQDDDGE